MKIRVCQCLCPRRHAILGFAFNDDTVTDQFAHGMLVTAIQIALDGRGKEIGLPLEGKINPWCPQCGAPSNEWTYEVRWSVEFSNWDEAVAALKDCESRQLIAHAVADMLGVSYDAVRKRSLN